MLRALALVLLSSAHQAWAHPGHGAPLFHWHEWDLGRIVIWLIVAAVAALAAWKSN